jgi:hypothetical protein
MQKIKTYMNFNEFKDNPVIKESNEINMFKYRYSLPSEDFSYVNERLPTNNDSHFDSLNNFNTLQSPD